MTAPTDVPTTIPMPPMYGTLWLCDFLELGRSTKLITSAQRRRSGVRMTAEATAAMKEKLQVVRVPIFTCLLCDGQLAPAEV